VIKGFGSTDCKCLGHLYYSLDTFSGKIVRRLEEACMNPHLIPISKDNDTK